MESTARKFACPVRKCRVIIEGLASRRCITTEMKLRKACHRVYCVNTLTKLKEPLEEEARYKVMFCIDELLLPRQKKFVKSYLKS